MSDDSNGRRRRPSAFSVGEEKPVRPGPQTRAPRSPASFEDNVVLTPDAEDPFRETTLAVEALTLPEAAPRKRRLSVGKSAVRHVSDIRMNPMRKPVASLLRVAGAGLVLLSVVLLAFLWVANRREPEPWWRWALHSLPAMAGILVIAGSGRLSAWLTRSFEE